MKRDETAVRMSAAFVDPVMRRRYTTCVIIVAINMLLLEGRVMMRRLAAGMRHEEQAQTNYCV